MDILNKKEAKQIVVDYGFEALYLLLEGSLPHLSLLQPIIRPGLNFYKNQKQKKFSSEALLSRDDILQYYSSLEKQWMTVPLRNNDIPIPATVSWDCLSGKRLSIVPQGITYEIPENLRRISNENLRVFHSNAVRKAVNGFHTCILSVDNSGPLVKLLCGKACYFDHAATHLMMDYVSSSEHTVRGIIHSDGGILDFDNCPLPNHIGVDAVFFTLDGYMAIAERNIRGVSTTGGMLGPTAAGGMQISDSDKLRETNIKNSFIMREGQEEVRIDEEHIVPGTLKVLGLVRDVLRGGKPQIVVVGQLMYTRSQFEKFRKDAVDSDEVKSMKYFAIGHHPIQDSYSIEEALLLRGNLAMAVDEYKDEMTEPLLAVLSLWYKYVIYTCVKELS